MRGFVKIDRKFFASEMWKERRKFSRFEAWLDIMQRAAYKGTEGAEAGEVKLTDRKTASAWGWEKTAVRRFIAKLIELGMMERTGKTSIFKVNQWCTTNRTTKSTTKSTDYQRGSGKDAPPNEPPTETPHLSYNKKDINKKGGVCSSHTPTRATEEEVSDEQWTRFDDWRWQNIPYMAGMIDRPMYGAMLSLAQSAGKTSKEMADVLTTIYYKKQGSDIMSAYKELIGA